MKLKTLNKIRTIAKKIAYSKIPKKTRRKLQYPISGYLDYKMYQILHYLNKKKPKRLNMFNFLNE